MSKKTTESVDSLDASSQSALALKAAAPASATTAQPAPGAPKATPAEWAQKLGHAFPARQGIPQSAPRVSREHAAADALFGWSEHAYHFQGPEQRFEIAEADYRAALATAGQHPTVKPHAAALPPSQADKFKHFEPRAARAKGRS